MNPLTGGEQRTIWAFWAAGAAAAIAGLMPIVFTGISGRLSPVVIPLWVGAAAFASCSLITRQGRTVTAIVYFIGGLAIVFALLAMFSLPLRLAVLGTCPVPPAPCPTGLGRPLTDAENTAMGSAAALGIAAMFLGFFGLLVLYRQTAVAPSMPPAERRIPAMPPATERAEAHAKDEPTAEKEQPEVAAHDEQALAELPAHEPESPAT